VAISIVHVVQVVHFPVDLSVDKRKNLMSEVLKVRKTPFIFEKVAANNKGKREGKHLIIDVIQVLHVVIYKEGGGYSKQILSSQFWVASSKFCNQNLQMTNRFLIK